MTLPAIAPIGAVALSQVSPVAQAHAGPQLTTSSFADLLTNGVAKTEDKLAQADQLVAQFAVDDSVPIHRVTYALEEARISFELMLQVRNRLLEGAQQLMNMQL